MILLLLCPVDHTCICQDRFAKTTTLGLLHNMCYQCICYPGMRTMPIIMCATSAPAGLVVAVSVAFVFVAVAVVVVVVWPLVLNPIAKLPS